jgi:hypothetical protein
VDVPDGWVVRGLGDDKRLPDGTMTYGWLYNRESGEPWDPGVVSIEIKDALTEGSTFEDVTAALAWDQADVEKIVAFMSAEAADVFPDYSAADVRVSMDADEIGGMPAKRNMLQCLKPCYIEGAAQTNAVYFVDGGDRVYVLNVTTGTQSKTADLLNQADAVVRTFRLE